MSTFEITFYVVSKDIAQVKAESAEEAKEKLKKFIHETSQPFGDVWEEINFFNAEEYIDVYDLDNWIVEEVG